MNPSFSKTYGPLRRSDSKEAYEGIIYTDVSEVKKG